MKIAAICAFNPHNTGMYTVDLALLSFMRRFEKQGPIQLALYTVERQQSLHLSTGTLRYEHLTCVDQLNEFDAILFWGDYLHSRRYVEGDLRFRLSRTMEDCASEEVDERLRQMSRLLLMADATPDLLARTICFGGAIHINNRRDELNSEYMADISRLYRGAALVLLRDPVSAALAQRYSSRDDDTLGVDAAFLLRNSDQFSWNQNPAGDRSAKVIGLSFGNRPHKDDIARERGLAFAHLFAQRFGFGDIRDVKWLELSPKAPLDDIAKKLSTICGCDLIISNTYHCCVNAWREGIPAIGIGYQDDRRIGSLADRKKQLLYAMFNAQRYYVHLEELASVPDHIVACDRVNSECGWPEVAEGITASIAQQTERSEKRLVKALLGLSRLG